MAQQGSQLDQEMFSCSICLDPLTDPVTLPCGHSYCMSCIKTHWDEEDEKKLHSCPQCRTSFTPRPVLLKNTMLADLVEQLKKTGPQAADLCSAGPEDVACDVCTDTKIKAVKSCLTCSASYCKKHLQPHYDAAPLKKHKLVEVSKKLQENICSRHHEAMQMFCRTDQQCICYLCPVDEHEGHDTVSAAAERTKRQMELQESRQRIQQRIQHRDNEVKLIQQEVETINRSADQTLESSEDFFTELIGLLDQRRSEVKQQIRSQQETEVSRVKELQEQLQQEVTELKRKDAELEQLSHTEDHTQFLQNYFSLACINTYIYFLTINPDSLQHFSGVQAAVLNAKEKIQDILDVEQTTILQQVSDVDVLLSREPRSRSEFLQCSQSIKLDPNTANTRLLLSKGNRAVTLMVTEQHYPHHTDRYTVKDQVLSKESLMGHCYWEVEKGLGGVSVVVSYKHSNTANEAFGSNENSWVFDIYKRGYEFRHNNIITCVAGPVSSRVGVFLDHRAGVLSFYSISGTMTVLHRVQTTFTQPLYAGLRLYGPTRNTAEICQL